MTDQEKFEAWYAERAGYGSKPERTNTALQNTWGNVYCEVFANNLWMAWQAAIASREPMTQQQQEDIMHPDDDLATFIRTIASVERLHGVGK